MGDYKSYSSQLKMIHFTGTLLLCILILYMLRPSDGKATKAAIPRSKPKSRVSFRLPGHGIFKKAVREMKIQFCSELEALTLQLTRPLDKPIPVQSMDAFISFADLEYDNPQLVVSMLVKLSRKYAESNVFTKLKSLLCLHRLMVDGSADTQKAITSVMKHLTHELDEKMGQTFFSGESVEKCAQLAVTVGEIEAVETVRVFSKYVLEVIDTYEERQPTARSSATRTVDDFAEGLLQLVELNELVEESCKRLDSELGQQCLEGVLEDRKLILEDLKQIQEEGKVDNSVGRDIGFALSKHGQEEIVVKGKNLKNSKDSDGKTKKEGKKKSKKSAKKESE